MSVTLIETQLMAAIVAPNEAGQDARKLED
jgi:hypothetical protein